MNLAWSRRGFLTTCAAGAFSLWKAAPATAAAPAIRVQTYTYKEVGGLAIKANVYRADDDQRRPVVVWIHA